jgi:outer membrane murein-binding lipoprotein Lpp
MKLMKKIVILSLVISVFVLTGCSNEDANNVVSEINNQVNQEEFNKLKDEVQSLKQEKDLNNTGITKTTEVTKSVKQEKDLNNTGITKTTEVAKSVNNVKNSNGASDEASNLPIYISKNLGISFRYPKGWYVKESLSDDRVYITNVQGDYDRLNLPSNFQNLWISAWDQETGVEHENHAQNTVDGIGPLVTSAINRDNFTINVYEHGAIGGRAMEAFWSDKSGKRYMAAHSTEVVNQQNMIESLKKILATVEFVE